MKFNFDIDDEKLLKLAGKINVPFVPFECRGVCGDLDPVVAHLNIVSFPSDNDPKGESYVKCGRLRGFFKGGSLLRCYKDKVGSAIPETVHYMREGQEKVDVCPYYNPKDKK